MKSKKSYIHKARRESVEPSDSVIKSEVLNICNKYKLHLVVNSKDDVLWECRPDLYSEKPLKIAVEIDGSYHAINEESRSMEHDLERTRRYKKNGVVQMIVNTDLIKFFGMTLEQWIVSQLWLLKISEGLKVDF